MVFSFPNFVINIKTALCSLLRVVIYTNYTKPQLITYCPSLPLPQHHQICIPLTKHKWMPNYFTINSNWAKSSPLLKILLYYWDHLYKHTYMNVKYILVIQRDIFFKSVIFRFLRIYTHTKFRVTFSNLAIRVEMKYFF